jgi:nitrite reductase/ring-hydroxylating ferredoxin subunit
MPPEQADGPTPPAAEQHFEAVAAPAPGQVLVATIDGVEVAIANTDGLFRAFDDTCSHRECPLSEGAIDESSVTCPCHKSRFDLTTGVPMNGPATLPIRIRAVRQEGEQLLVER